MLHMTTDIFCLLSSQSGPVLNIVLLLDFIIRVARRVSLVNRNWVPFRETLVHPDFSGVLVTQCLVD